MANFIDVKLFNLMVGTNEVIKDISIHAENSDQVEVNALLELQNTLIRARDDTIAYLKKEKAKIDILRGKTDPRKEESDA